MQMTVMDKVLSSFLDNFFEEAAEEDRKGLTNVTEESSRRVLDKVREYIDNLQNVLYDGKAPYHDKCFTLHMFATTSRTLSTVDLVELLGPCYLHGF